MSDTQTDLLYEQSGPIATVTLNRPERRNALALSLIESLERQFTQIASDRSVRVVILAAAGPVFCSGHDLRELATATPEQGEQLFSACAHMMLTLRNLPQPVIGRVQGLATAAGCQLAATCDLVVAAESAQFATPGLKIGLFCTTPMVPLVRVLPAKLALEMLLTAEPISAERAREGGLVNRVVPAAELTGATQDLAQQLARASPEVVALGKRAFYRQLPLAESDAYADAVPLITANATHPDAREGIAAFLEKRSPRWSQS
ncbi:MAG: enoyl-CoA hydratase [Planctomycetaceae bacterium]